MSVPPGSRAMTKDEFEKVLNERLACVLKIAADLVRKKRDSLHDWDAGYSSDDAQRAECATHNAVQDSMRTALSEVADVCEEVAEKIVCGK